MSLLLSFSMSLFSVLCFFLSFILVPIPVLIPVLILSLSLSLSYCIMSLSLSLSFPCPYHGPWFCQCPFCNFSVLISYLFCTILYSFLSSSLLLSMFLSPLLIHVLVPVLVSVLVSVLVLVLAKSVVYHPVLVCIFLICRTQCTVLPTPVTLLSLSLSSSFFLSLFMSALKIKSN
jgi:hypothetical protein